MNIKGVIVLSEAKASESPMVKPSRIRNIMMAFGAALMAGVTLAFFLHFLDETVKSERQLSEKTDLPVLGVVYDIKNQQTRSDEKHFGSEAFGIQKKKSRRGLAQISVLHHKSLVAEQYRTIRTNIEFSSVQTHLRSILVTSSVPGEGKSFSAANLAAVFARRKKSLLVDADLRKPTIHETYQLENVQGLTNVLVGNASSAKRCKNAD